MRVLLIDADSKIPNLALMKLSTHYKNLGASIELLKFNIPYYPSKTPKNQKHYTIPPNYDLYYCSIIFNQNQQLIIPDSQIQPNNLIFGGTGSFNPTQILPDEIESLLPDYTLYPENTTTSYGFITRGCIRNCSFCVVPKKEGQIHQVSTPSIISNPNHKYIKYLDNNILAYPDHLNILQEIIDLNKPCQFIQGLDIRLITPENSYLISKLPYFGNITFAFDDYDLLQTISKHLRLLPWRKPYQLRFYLYATPAQPISNLISRINFCRENQILPYIMRDIACFTSPDANFYTDIASYVNQPHLFKKLTLEQFLYKRYAHYKTLPINRITKTLNTMKITTI